MDVMAPAPPLDLAATFAGLVRHHIATPVAPLPEARPGITWVWCSGGIYKRGVTPDLDILIPVARAPEVPGLAKVLPHVRWSCWPGRLDGRLLVPLLEDARRASSGDTILRPIEKQYCFVYRDGTIKLVAPVQRGTAGQVMYAPVQRGVTLCDLHSHHHMAAYFSATDDRDDTGLSVSVVVGTIFTRPTIACRLNVYGHRARVPALLIFDQIGPFEDTYGGHNADPHD